MAFQSEREEGARQFDSPAHGKAAAVEFLQRAFGGAVAGMFQAFERHIQQQEQHQHQPQPGGAGAEEITETAAAGAEEGAGADGYDSIYDSEEQALLAEEERMLEEAIRMSLADQQVHCLSVTFHCLCTAFPLTFTDLSPHFLAVLQQPPIRPSGGDGDGGGGVGVVAAQLSAAAGSEPAVAAAGAMGGFGAGGAGAGGAGADAAISFESLAASAAQSLAAARESLRQLDASMARGPAMARHNAGNGADGVGGAEDGGGAGGGGGGAGAPRADPAPRPAAVTGIQQPERRRRQRHQHSQRGWEAAHGTRARTAAGSGSAGAGRSSPPALRRGFLGPRPERPKRQAADDGSGSPVPRRQHGGQPAAAGMRVAEMRECLVRRGVDRALIDGCLERWELQALVDESGGAAGADQRS